MSRSRGFPYAYCSDILFEDKLGKLGEIDAPVAPDVSAVGFAIGIFVAFFVEVTAKVGILPVEEVGFAYSNPVEFRIGGKQCGKLLLHGIVTFQKVVERFGLVATNV